MPYCEEEDDGEHEGDDSGLSCNVFIFLQVHKIETLVSYREEEDDGDGDGSHQQRNLIIFLQVHKIETLVSYREEEDDGSGDENSSAAGNRRS